MSTMDIEFGPVAAAYLAEHAMDEIGAAVLRSTVAAVAMRDLVDCHGFTQAHYDTLTAPWVRVIGSAHPDDDQ